MFFNMLGTWIRGLLSIALLVSGVLLVREWVENLPTQTVYVAADGREVRRALVTFPERVEAWKRASDRSTAPLVGGLLLLLFSVGGRWVSPLMWRRRGESRRRSTPVVRRMNSRHGYELNVEMHGVPSGPPLILVHGVGSNRTQWREVIEDVGDRFHIFAFDLLGHGNSRHVARAEHTLEAAADDLNDVMALAGGEPVYLVGHSMGGMIALTWCAADPRRLSRLAGLVLVHTTAQNPFLTMKPAPLHRALQKPVHEPLLRVTTAIPWVVRLMNGLDYLNGTSHWANDLQMFGGTESRDQLERSARLHATMDPAATARFSLSMTRYDVRSRLSTIDVPALVVAADKDGVTPPEASDLLAEGLPDAELLVLPGTRHMGYMERRSEFAEAMVRLEERSAKKPARAAAR